MSFPLKKNFFFKQNNKIRLNCIVFSKSLSSSKILNFKVTVEIVFKIHHLGKNQYSNK